jgi:hypothetical protein
MKNLFKSTFIILYFSFYSSFAQGVKQDTLSSKKSSWFKDNVSIRKTFDGSKNENKPSTISLFENHKSSNDFLNIDIALKINEWEFLENLNSILLFYPVMEWHKSTNEEDEKNKLSFGLNGEFYMGRDWKLKPYVLSSLTLKRNLIDNVNELKYVGQFSLFSLKKGYPGADWVFDNKTDFKGRWYPYIGYEYNEIPDLIVEGNTEKFSMFFLRIHLEYWFSPKTVQFIFNGIYRNALNTTENIKNDLPLLTSSINYYPGKQENISIGLDYQNGYDPDSKFQQIESTSLNLKVSF